MATLQKSLLFLLLLLLIFTQITSNPSPEIVEAFSSEPGDSALEHDVDHLKSKISVLESTIDERSHELSIKDESIRQLEMAIQEKSDSISSLQIEIEYFQQKATLDAKDQMSNSHVRATELEKQVDNLRKEIEMQNKKKDALEVRTNVAEGKIRELNLKLEDIQRINSEQKSKIHNAEHALQLAQEEMMKAKLRADSVSKELREVHGKWLPHWIAVHIFHFQSYLVFHWNEHGRPALDITIQKAFKKKDQLKRWAEPQIRNVNTHLIPMIKEEWSNFINYLEPHLQSLLSKIIEVYNASKNSLTPHLVKARKLTDPYIQEVKKFSEPYINLVVMVTKPHYETMQVALKPYTKKSIRTYRKLIKSACLYHHQATAGLTLPILVLFKVFSVIFSGKTKGRTFGASINHTRRRMKRHHPDKYSQGR
ncbi:uncharacterized protein LOC111285066 isoform X2 [Durio zibethinus]|uniref:Uncharacterized protein LOC111285066 isoform X2 n=1 Tax=Durio zibethinus TaxID=66656 RepID=A0A6P5XNV4_DURZI|nr:uncharacterized protein LOC111285066 isoform X2 [Durio zibethinus]